MDTNTLKTIKDLELRLKGSHIELDRLERTAYGITLPELAKLVIKLISGENEL